MNSILLFTVINALFWGLFPHSTHCQFVNYMSRILHVTIECPEHKIHMLMGLLFFALSIFIAQRDSMKI